jgi:hypothetical protein
MSSLRGTRAHLYGIVTAAAITVLETSIAYRLPYLSPDENRENTP